MSSYIHHGAPGSFKTSGAIHDALVPALLEGRRIVTNINGLDDTDKIYEILEAQGKTVDKRSEIVSLSLSDNNDLEKMRRWWHWVQNGDFIFFDEIQVIFPKSWRPDRELRKFWYPASGGDSIVKVDGVDRYPTLGWAMQQHRHQNLDIVFTTPDIKLVNQEIRSSCETAFKHTNLGIFGAVGRGTYKETMHLATNSGNPSDALSFGKKKIPDWVFSLYSSTKTGNYSDTKAGTNIFKNPRILFLGFVMALAIGYVVYLDYVAPYLAKTSYSAKPVDQVVENNSKNAGANSVAPPNLPPRVVGGSGVAKAVAKPYDFLENATLEIDSYLLYDKFELVNINARTKDRLIKLDQNVIKMMGVKLIVYDRCYMQLQTPKFAAFAFCSDEIKKQAPSAVDPNQQVLPKLTQN